MRYRGRCSNSAERTFTFGELEETIMQEMHNDPESPRPRHPEASHDRAETQRAPDRPSQPRREPDHSVDPESRPKPDERADEMARRPAVEERRPPAGTPSTDPGSRPAFTPGANSVRPEPLAEPDLPARMMEDDASYKEHFRTVREKGAETQVKHSQAIAAAPPVSALAAPAALPVAAAGASSGAAAASVAGAFLGLPSGAALASTAASAAIKAAGGPGVTGGAGGLGGAGAPPADPGILAQAADAHAKLAVPADGAVDGAPDPTATGGAEQVTKALADQGVESGLDAAGLDAAGPDAIGLDALGLEGPPAPVPEMPSAAGAAPIQPTNDPSQIGPLMDSIVKLMFP